MKRSVMRLGAIIGVTTVATLVTAPTFAAAATSQSAAQSLQLSIAGNSAVSQKVTASNNGSGEQKSNGSTLPLLADVLPANNLIGAGVAPQDARANADGTSYACAGIAGTGSDGVVTVGNKSCEIDSKNLVDINLANLDLGNALIGDQGAITGALQDLPGLGDLLTQLSTTLDGLVDQISGAVNGTPLGEISIGGSLSAIEASCVANPEAASGDTRLVDTSGGNTVPISLTLPTVGDLTLVNLPANPPPNTKAVTQLDVVTQALIDGLKQELATVVQGQLSGLGLGDALQTVQDQVVTQLVAQLQPLLQPVEQYLADITLNKQVKSEGGRKIEVTALDAQVLPAAQDAIGASLISGQIGQVSCGPNTRGTATPESPQQPESPELPDVPTVVDSGVAGHQDHTARNVLGATAALMLLAGTAGLVGYRRMLGK